MITTHQHCNVSASCQLLLAMGNSNDLKSHKKITEIVPFKRVFDTLFKNLSALVCVQACVSLLISFVFTQLC